MKVKVNYFKMGHLNKGCVEVEVAEGAKVEDTLKAAGVPFNDETMSMKYAIPGEAYFTGHAHPDDIVADGQTIGVFDDANFDVATTVAAEAPPEVQAQT
ncbi:MAG: hypothetical protein WCV50_06080 [Patescibacteria group bacterium]|jgi:hypothetical protein